ncbi:MAG: hypothetical protein ACR2HA_02435 [Nocardioides sp.]
MIVQPGPMVAKSSITTSWLNTAAALMSTCFPIRAKRLTTAPGATGGPDSQDDVGREPSAVRDDRRERPTPLLGESHANLPAADGRHGEGVARHFDVGYGQNRCAIQLQGSPRQWSVVGSGRALLEEPDHVDTCRLAVARSLQRLAPGSQEVEAAAGDGVKSGLTGGARIAAR